MSRFAEGTDPEYIRQVNEQLYGDKSTTNRPDKTEGDPLPDTQLATDNVTSAGYMGIPKIGWIAIIGVLGYFAYKKGVFKK
jgi:hypothetical protein